MKFKKVLAIETSCDDTSVAIVGDDAWVYGLVSANQDSAHFPFGGIVPEIASRNHSQNLLPLIEQVLKKTNLKWAEIDGFVVTNRPGLIGSLIVGLVTAKSLSQALEKPFIGVNHLEGHILAPFLRDEEYQPIVDLNEPFIGMAISGGHSSFYHIQDWGKYEILGSTLDDAAGEAFDKFAKMIGLGFPGGQKIDQLSAYGNPKAYEFPRSFIKENHLNMSFSGLKSSAHRLITQLTKNGEVLLSDEQIHDLCASFQEAIVDVLIAKLARAVKLKKLKKALITGGVSANSRLRLRAKEWANSSEVQLLIPPLRYCTDNAAMIGLAGIYRLNRGEFSDINLAPSPSALPFDFIQIETCEEGISS